jgi:hypothetical protein
MLKHVAVDDQAKGLSKDPVIPLSGQSNVAEPKVLFNHLANWRVVSPC